MVKGKFSLKFTNVHTGEVRMVEKSNVWSQSADDMFLNTNTGMSYLNDGYGIMYADYMRVYLLTTPVLGGLKAANTLAGVSFVRQNSVEMPWVTTGTNPIIRTREDRFQPPATGTSRTIYGLSIAPSDGGGYYSPASAVLSYTALETPCVQTDSEVLDVVYRLEINTESNPMASEDVQFVKNFNFGDSIARLWTGGVGSSNYTSKIASVGSGWFKMPTDATKFTTFLHRSDDDNFLMRGDRWAENYSLYARTPTIRRTYSSSYPTDSYVGNLLRTALYSNNVQQADGNFERVQMFSPVFGDDFPNKPVQPVHNHSIGASCPFIDVNFLASGRGAVGVQPGTWTDTTGMLEYWRADIKNTGQVGDSRYFVRKNVRGEFDENTYTHEQRNNNQIPGLHVHGNVWSGVEVARTPDTAHISVNMQNAQPWIDHKTVINHNTAGVTLTDIITNDYVNFDGDSTPALPATSVYQVAVLPNGDLYVACSATGLWKISSPMFSPTITKVTNSTPGVDDNHCYGVCEGYNASIWAIFDNGVGHSTDNGVTWTNYTTANGGWKHRSAVTLEEITGASNWDTFRMIRADITKPNHEIGFVRHSAANMSEKRGSLVWWSPGRDAVDYKLNAPQSSFIGLLAFDGGPARTSFFRCSRTDGFWAVRTLENSWKEFTSYVYYLKHYASGAFKTVGSTDWQSMYIHNHWTSVAKGQYGALGFLYDHYGKSYAAWGTRHYHSSDYPAVTTLNDRFSESLGSIATGVTSTSGIYAPIMSEVVFEQYTLSNEATPYVTSSIYGAYIANPHLTDLTGYTWDRTATLPVNDPLNGKTYPTKEMSWIDYRWNGTSWQKDYHAPLLDTSGNGNNAVRHLFDIESHTFTGRSSLDVSSVGADDFSQGLTVTGTYSFTNKPLAHSSKHSMFSTENVSVYRDMVAPNELRVAVKSQDGYNKLPYTFAAETNNRITTTIASTANTSYDFKRSNLNTWSVDGHLFHMYEDKFVGYVINETDVNTTHTYSTYFSPVYTAIANDNFSIKFKPTIPTTASGGPGEGLRLSVRYGDYDFTNSLDTYFDDTGSDRGGARPRDGVWVYLPPNNGNPTAGYMTTTLPYTQATAITVNDTNGTNRLELKFAIVAGVLTITLLRIADGVGPITPVTLGTWTHTASYTSGGKNGIVMLTPQYNTYAITSPSSITDFELFDNTTSATFGKTAYTSTVSLNVNGTLLGAIKYATASPLNEFDTLWLGMDTYRKNHFFTGALSNPQVWNIAWNQSDVTADAADVTGVIDTATAPSVNLIARYNMAQSLVETKPTHTTPQALPGGHTITFSNGSSNGISTFAFTDTDYYTFGMFDGVLKDNAISFNIKQEMYVRPHDFDYAKLESPNNRGIQSNIISAVTVPRTELVQFRETTTSRRLGEIIGVSAGAPDDCAVSVQTITGDGWVEGRVTLRNTQTIGLQTSMLATSAVTGTGAYVRLNTAGGFTCHVNNVVVNTTADNTYNVGDVFRVERVNTDTTPEFKFYRNGTLVVSSATGPAGVLCANFGDMNYAPSGWAEVKMNYLRQWPSLEIGDFAASTGKFDPEFITFVDDRVNLWTVTIDGVAATKVLVGDKTGSTIGNYSVIPPSIPAGSVYIIPDIGVLFFSGGDIGKTVTVKAPLVTYT